MTLLENMLKQLQKENEEHEDLYDHQHFDEISRDASASTIPQSMPAVGEQPALR